MVDSDVIIRERSPTVESCMIGSPLGPQALGRRPACRARAHSTSTRMLSRRRTAASWACRRPPWGQRPPRLGLGIFAGNPSRSRARSQSGCRTRHGSGRGRRGLVDHEAATLEFAVDPRRSVGRRALTAHTQVRGGGDDWLGNGLGRPPAREHRRGAPSRRTGPCRCLEASSWCGDRGRRWVRNARAHVSSVQVFFLERAPPPARQCLSPAAPGTTCTIRFGTTRAARAPESPRRAGIVSSSGQSGFCSPLGSTSVTLKSSAP